MDKEGWSAVGLVVVILLTIGGVVAGVSYMVSAATMESGVGRDIAWLKGVAWFVMSGWLKPTGNRLAENIKD